MLSIRLPYAMHGNGLIRVALGVRRSYERRKQIVHLIFSGKAMLRQVRTYPVTTSICGTTCTPLPCSNSIAPTCAAGSIWRPVGGWKEGPPQPVARACVYQRERYDETPLPRDDDRNMAWTAVGRQGLAPSRQNRNGSHHVGVPGRRGCTT